MRANIIANNDNYIYINRLCNFIENINQCTNSLNNSFCAESLLRDLIPGIPLAIVLFSKVEFKAVEVIDIKFPNKKLSIIVKNGRLCKKSKNLVNLLNENGERFNIITHGIRDIERRYISICCISYKPETQFDASWSLLKIIAPHLHIAITNNYQRGQSQSSLEKKLTTRELEILWWVSKGKTNYEIGMILSISAFTVKNHVSNIFFKLQVSNRAQALGKAMSLGYFWN